MVGKPSPRFVYVAAHQGRALQSDRWSFPPSWCSKRALTGTDRTSDRTWQVSSTGNSQSFTRKPVDFPRHIFNSERLLLSLGVVLPSSASSAQGIPTTLNVRWSKMWREVDHQEKGRATYKTQTGLTIWGTSPSLNYEPRHFLTEQCRRGIFTLPQPYLYIRFREIGLAAFQVYSIIGDLLYKWFKGNVFFSHSRRQASFICSTTHQPHHGAMEKKQGKIKKKKNSSLCCLLDIC